MTKKIILTIITLIVLGVAVFFYFEYKGEQELQEYANSVQVQNSNNTNVQTESSTSAKTFTLAEISTHNTRTDCWLLINGDVLDVTTFVDKHPGGTVILQGCGKDATNYFNNVPEHVKGVVKTIYKGLVIGKLAN